MGESLALKTDRMGECLALKTDRRILENNRQDDGVSGIENRLS